MPRNAHFIGKRLIKLIGYYTQLPRFVAQGPRASQCPLYRKTSNQVNWVLYQNIIEESSKISRSVQFSFFGIVLYPDLDRQ